MSSVSIAGDTSGSVLLQAPAVSGSTTINIAAQSGTLNVGGPAFSAYAYGNQSVSNVTWTKVNLTQEAFDTNNNFASSRFTPTVAGYYQINGYIRIDVSGNANRLIVGLWKNGAEYARVAEPILTTNVLVSGTQLGGGTVIYFNGTTDYVELYGYVNGSGTILFSDAGNQAYTSSMTGCFLRGA